MSSIPQKIMKRVKSKDRGWVFTAHDFTDFSTRKNLNAALCRLSKNGDIRRIARGFYDYPETHDEMGVLAPSLKGIAQAVVRQTGDRLTHSGATAANMLGLTTQVQGKIIFTTTGKARKIPVQDKYIRLVPSLVPTSLLDWDDPVSMALQALENIGQKRITQKHIQKCAGYLSEKDKARIKKHLPDIKEDWLRDVARQLSES